MASAGYFLKRHKLKALPRVWSLRNSCVYLIECQPLEAQCWHPIGRATLSSCPHIRGTYLVRGTCPNWKCLCHLCPLFYRAVGERFARARVSLGSRGEALDENALSRTTSLVCSGDLGLELGHRQHGVCPGRVRHDQRRCSRQ